MEHKYTRAAAREFWQASGLTYSDLTAYNLRMLRGMVDRSMKRTGFMQGSYRAHQRWKLKLDADRSWADLRCRSYYFNDRQAITFEPGGFIGFAGWSDEWNVQPILDGFIKWAAIISRSKAIEANGSGMVALEQGE